MESPVKDTEMEVEDPAPVLTNKLRKIYSNNLKQYIFVFICT